MPKNPRPVKLDFPVKGVSQTTPYAKSISGHAFDALNMVPFDRQEERMRGGRRGGLRKYFLSKINNGNLVQALVRAPTRGGVLSTSVGDDNRVLHYEFDTGSGTAVTDSSSEGRDGSFVGSPTWVTGKVGSNALQFNGSTDYVLTDAQIPTPTEAITVACWVKGDNATFRSNDSRTWVSKEPSFWLGPAGLNTRIAWVFGNNLDLFLLFFVDTIPGFDITEWHHYAGTWDEASQTARLFVDGVERASETYGGGVTMRAKTNKVGIGTNFGATRNWDGAIDDVRIYDQALDGATIGSLGQVLTEGDPIRKQYLVAVSGGNVYRSNTPPSEVDIATNGSSALDTTQFLAAQFGPPSPSDSSPADIQSHVYFADGTNYKKLNVETNEISDWTAAVGSMPTDNDGNAGRILALYRGRLVISGLTGDPTNWFMSAADDVRDFEYSPSTPNANQAVAGNVSDAGKVGDIVTALIPLNDDMMLFGGDQTIWRLSGDPAEGGRFDNISYEAGIVGPDAWCRDTFGGVYYMTTQGLMRLSPTRTQESGGNTSQTGGIPEIVSTAKLDQTFKSINRGTTRVLLAWDRDNEGVYIFLTPLTQPSDAPKAYWFDARTQSFWPLKFPAVTGPTAVAVYDGDRPDDRSLMMGGWDSFIRIVAADAKNDTTTSEDVAVESYVDFGPMGGDNITQRVLLTDIMTVLDRASDPVELRLFTGATPEQTIEGTMPRISRTLRGGMNNVGGQRVAGNSVLVRLYQNTLDSSWIYETGMIRLADMGLQRRLG